MDRPSSSVEEPKGKAFIVILVFTIIFVGMNLFISYKRTEPIDSFQNFSLYTMEFILNSFHQPPVTDITFLEGNSTCMHNKSIVLYEWSSFEICPCPDSNRNYVDVPCPPVGDPQRSKCAEPFFIHQNLTKWRNKTICYERSEKWYTSFKPCKEGYKRCSKQICVSKNETCPYTLIEKKEPPFELNENMTDLGPVGDNTHLVGVRDSSQNTTVISLRVSMVTHPCVNPYLKPNRTSQSIYPSHFPGEIGCLYRDDVIYKKVDEYNEYEMLKENNITHGNDVFEAKVVEGIEGITKEGLAKLYFQKRLLFRDDSDCSLYQDKDFVKDMENLFKYENMKRDTVNKLVFFLELWTIILIILLLIQFQPFKNCFRDYCINSCTFSVQFYGTIAINSLLILFIFYIVVTINSEGDEVDDILKEITETYEKNTQGCFQYELYDSFIKRIFEYFSERTEAGYSYSRKVIGMMIIFIILMIMSNFISTWFLDNYKTYKVRNEKVSQKQVTELVPLVERED